MADKDTVTMYPPRGKGEPVEVPKGNVETMKNRGWTEAPTKPAARQGD